MASLVARAVVAAAALPSGRARHLGSGRLSLAALPGHGAVVLAGRRDGTGRAGGVLAVVLKAPARDVKAACDPTDGIYLKTVINDNEDDFELVKLLKTHLALNMKSRSLFEISVEKPLRRMDQLTIALCAENSFSLWVNVANRLRPAMDTKLHQALRRCGDTLIDAVVRGHKCYATGKVVSDLIEALEIIRHLVSSVLEAPLPLDCTWLSLELDDPEIVLFKVLECTYQAVEKDVKFMLENGKSAGGDAHTAPANSA